MLLLLLLYSIFYIFKYTQLYTIIQTITYTKYTRTLLKFLSPLDRILIRIPNT